MIHCTNISSLVCKFHPQKKTALPSSMGSRIAKSFLFFYCKTPSYRMLRTWKGRILLPLNGRTTVLFKCVAKKLFLCIDFKGVSFAIINMSYIHRKIAMRSYIQEKFLKKIIPRPEVHFFLDGFSKVTCNFYVSLPSLYYLGVNRSAMMTICHATLACWVA